MIPKYAELARRGQIELTFSPYYHPILPLLVDLESARAAIPQIRLPTRRFAHREDAERQIEMGMSSFERLMGVHPRGMWPSEMAVGDSVASLAAQAGVEWIISDDDVLARSLEAGLTRDGEGRLHQPEVLYGPYEMEREGGRVALVFRDALLSNLIGFDYHRMPPLDAVADFMRRLRRIREQQGEDRDFLVTVALDGENAWDFYTREGNDFLDALYSELDRAEDVVCTTVADFLHAHPERRPLHRLHTGSWIGATLDTWIGDPEHNTAWDLLSETRDWLEDYAQHHPHEAEQVTAAWREVMITEGSDWFWWFSRKHDSGMDQIWENQYRLHLRNVYKLVGARQPASLFKPILERAGADERRMPLRNISPATDDDPAWENAGRYEVGSGFGALHKPVGYISRLLYGSDETHLHLRIDSACVESRASTAGWPRSPWTRRACTSGSTRPGRPRARRSANPCARRWPRPRGSTSASTRAPPSGSAAARSPSAGSARTAPRQCPPPSSSRVRGRGCRSPSTRSKRPGANPCSWRWWSRCAGRSWSRSRPSARWACGCRGAPTWPRPAGGRRSRS